MIVLIVIRRGNVARLRKVTHAWGLDNDSNRLANDYELPNPNRQRA
jgi:hypothetical protein